MRCFYDYVLVSWTNNYFKIDLPKLVDKDDAIKKLNKYINKPTLVIIDNIERLDKDSWEIIKIIQKLQSLENFIFVLPINVNKLKSTTNINDGS